jgi:hypothetical protein
MVDMAPPEDVQEKCLHVTVLPNLFELTSWFVERLLRCAVLC